MFTPIYEYKTYFVNEDGEIIRLIGDKKKTVKPFIHPDGTKQVSLSEQGKVKKFTVHKIVSETFIPNPNKWKHIIHKDNNLSNNSVSNLEWSKSMQGHSKKVEIIS